MPQVFTHVIWSQVSFCIVSFCTGLQLYTTFIKHVKPAPVLGSKEMCLVRCTCRSVVRIAEIVKGEVENYVEEFRLCENIYRSF